MKTIKVASIIGLSALTLFSCSKYEENDGVTVKSKKARVANTWVIDQAFSDGENVTENYDEFTLTTKEDGDAQLNAKFEWGPFSYEYETDGTWEFTSSKENISFDYEDDDADKTYQILKLEVDEMWLRETGGEDELHLKAQ
ncbi:hypothetical protein [Crocinitomix catalasitica]|uniref:hypothetical protein n=1 Tax=Crocinitomix catalasitica TaxID=184607 RepID=UPI0004830E07|nr:hypothetical protein [Crocinitomix catalasitica]